MTKTATKAAKSAPKAPPVRSIEKGYKSHNKGSRKGRIHELFDKQGADTAWTAGLKAGLKEGTLRAWFGVWRREAPAKKGKGKAATPPKPEAESPAKAA